MGISNLSIINCSKRYNKRLVLRDISLYVNSGEVVGLVGPNGAGKTTCFNIIAGIIKPCAGRIVLYDNDITKLPMYKRARLGISYLPQETSIFRGLKVGENVEAILELVIEDANEREDKLNALLSEFNITHLKDSPVLSLSGGEKRRLEIARTLATNPKFILLDEPLAGIDPLAIHDIKKLISYLREKGIGILITDHNVREMLEIADRAYVIYDGQVLLGGTSDEIINSQDAKEFYLGKGFRM